MILQVIPLKLNKIANGVGISMNDNKWSTKQVSDYLIFCNDLLPQNI